MEQALPAKYTSERVSNHFEGKLTHDSVESPQKTRLMQWQNLVFAFSKRLMLRAGPSNYLWLRFWLNSRATEIVKPITFQLYILLYYNSKP